MKAWPAFRLGLVHTLRYRQVWLLLFAANLAAALALALLPTLALTSAAGRSLAVRDAADGLDAWLLLETMLSPSIQSALQGPGTEPVPPAGLTPVLLSVLISALALPLLAWLPSAFLNGGVLLTYADATVRCDRREAPALPGCDPPADPARFRWRRFLWGCGHWFGAFLLLGGIQGVGLGLLLVVGLIAAGWFGPAAGTAPAALLTAAVAFVAMLWLALIELTRALAVAGGTRRVTRAFSRACGFLFGRLPQVAGLYGLVLLVAAALHALFRLGLFPLLPLDCWPLVLLVQQTFLFGRLGTRLVRQAGLLALLLSTDGSAAPSLSPAGVDQRLNVGKRRLQVWVGEQHCPQPKPRPRRRPQHPVALI